MPLAKRSLFQASALLVVGFSLQSINRGLGASGLHHQFFSSKASQDASYSSLWDVQPTRKSRGAYSAFFLQFFENLAFVIRQLRLMNFFGIARFCFLFAEFIAGFARFHSMVAEILCFVAEIITMLAEFSTSFATFVPRQIHIRDLKKGIPEVPPCSFVGKPTPDWHLPRSPNFRRSQARLHEATRKRPSPIKDGPV